MIIEDEELLGDFVVESKEHLADVENQLLAIEGGGAAIDLDLVNTVFRAIHSVKGAAGFLGLDTINRLAHSLENVLNKIRNEELIPTPESTDVMLRAADVLRTLVNDTANSNAFDPSALIAELDIVEQGKPAPVAPPAAPPTEAVVEALSEAVTDEDLDAALEAALAARNASVAEPATPATPKPEPVALAPGKPAETTSPAPVAPESSIRVSISVLDKLMNLAGELVLSRNQLMQALASPDSSTLNAAAGGLDHVTGELQEAIMQTRMQPIGNVFGKFLRIVRDLSSKLGKQCNLTVEGKEVEVDKTIVEAIGDPLTHLVRNSVDHGIELPEVRTKNGKSAAGTIALRAFHKAGKVCIEIEDDGGGIDPKRLLGKAVEKGVVSAERAEQMTDREVVRLIFHPGFSTAEKVSDVSGRGVGMDVVRTNIEKLGGVVDVESAIGKGTIIRVTLPLTLAIIPSMIVRCGGERFAIPQANISELVRLRPEEVATKIASVQHGQVLRLRGALLPLVQLDSALHLTSEENRDTQAPRSIIVVETGQSRYGLIVDGLSDSEEIVVKPLGRHVADCTYLAGATILGDGRIALILDVAGLATQAGVHLVEASSEKTTNIDAVETTGVETQKLLLLRCAPMDRFAIPMEVVTRIERVRADQIDRIGGRQLLQYRGVSLPLVSVDEVLDVAPQPECQHVFIVVFHTGEREIGLVAPFMDDIREVTTTIDDQTHRVPGVIGSMVVDDQLLRMLDVFELARAIHPQWFAEKTKPEASGSIQVLLAEDSGFFRKQVSKFLISEGFEITEAVDGLDAWEQMQATPDAFDLVVTDIEMPNMNGFELCQRIKELRPALPAIALTSLSSDEHLEQGRQVGFDEYQVKMHTANLLQAAVRLTASKSAKRPARNVEGANV